MPQTAGSEARAAYGQVIARARRAPTGRVRQPGLALAEILYRQEHFRDALDLYETEIASRSYEDHIYRLARAGFIRKSIAAGEFLFRYGEIPAARKRFKSLIDYDDTVTEAHRGIHQVCGGAWGISVRCWPTGGSGSMPVRRIPWPFTPRRSA